MNSPLNKPGNGTDNWGEYPTFTQGHQSVQPPFTTNSQVPTSHSPPPTSPAQPLTRVRDSFPHGQQQTQAKSMIVAAILAFFLGGLGIHNFYLGYTRIGVIQLSMTITGMVLSIVFVGFILLSIVGIWAFMQFVMILIRHGQYGVDADGVPLQ